MANTIAHETFSASHSPRARYHEVSTDLEFSDFGRDSRVPPGLWMLLSPFLSIALVWMAVHLF